MEESSMEGASGRIASSPKPKEPQQTGTSRRQRKAQGSEGGNALKGDPVFQPQYVHGKAYQFGVECTFCGANRATHHCVECSFLCSQCTEKIHSHQKHSHHKRNRISKYDAVGACHAIRGFFRHLKSRKLLKALALKAFTRYYDASSRSYYYYCKRSMKTQWTPPLCLTEADFGTLGTDQAAKIIQEFFRRIHARRVLRDRTLALYERVYVPGNKGCYHAYLGKSIRARKTRWTRPLFLYPDDQVKLRLTDEVAAIKIQYQWRRHLTYRLLRKLVRKEFKRVLDPIMNTHCYWTSDGTYLRHKPYLLGNERWENMNMMLWTMQEVMVFIRRLGLKEYVPVMQEFQIDGGLLLACEDSDFRIMGIITPFHLKKLKLAIERTHKQGEEDGGHQTLYFRRLKIRRNYERRRAAQMIQCHYRRFRARKLLNELKARYQAARSKRLSASEINNRWYTELPILQAHINAAATGERGVLKSYGKRKPIRGALGWGSWKGGEEWVEALPEAALLSLKGAEPDGHDSVFWIRRLDQYHRK